METFYGILVAIALSIVIMFFQKKKKETAWSGIVKKIVIKKANHNIKPEYSSSSDWTDQAYIHYRMDSGKKGKIHITAQQLNQQYPDLKAGDKLIKKAGAYFPDMVSGS